MKYIKLTEVFLVNGNAVEFPCFIFIDKIAGISKDALLLDLNGNNLGEFTNVILDAGSMCLSVKETPEEILQLIKEAENEK